MIQQRKKDYLERLVEEFFTNFRNLVDDESSEIDEDRLIPAFDFFVTNLSVRQEDDSIDIIRKTQDIQLSEQYARLLYRKYVVSELKEQSQLHKALEIILYLEKSDRQYSWTRTVLREDLLHLLEDT